MPITVAEKWASREGTQGEGASTDLRFVIQGTDDDTDAKSALIASSPLFYAGIVLRPKLCLGRNIPEALLRRVPNDSNIGDDSLVRERVF